MPKLVIKNELPPPSAQDRFINVLQNILFVFLIAIAVIAIGYFYFFRTPDAPPPSTQLHTQTAVAPNDVTLPDDFCPLFGSNAGECKKTDK